MYISCCRARLRLRHPQGTGSTFTRTSCFGDDALLQSRPPSVKSQVNKPDNLGLSIFDLSDIETASLLQSVTIYKPDEYSPRIFTWANPLRKTFVAKRRKFLLTIRSIRSSEVVPEDDRPKCVDRSLSLIGSAPSGPRPIRTW